MTGLLGGGVAGVLAGCGLLARWNDAPVRILAIGICAAAMVPLILGALMVAYALGGKARMRERMLDAVPWSGDEQVLDIVTGGGLLLIGAAQRLRDGRAVGNRHLVQEGSISQRPGSNAMQHCDGGRW